MSEPDPIVGPDGELIYPDIEEFSQEVTTVETKVRSDFTDVAFLGEVGITGIARIHRCVALRGGYQAMLVDGVGQGMDAFFASGMNNGTVFYHGLQFGVEYRQEFALVPSGRSDLQELSDWANPAAPPAERFGQWAMSLPASWLFDVN